ncbi:hypothetical protein [Bacillus solitudinis]|uniref:hypothetical protein n=1 Tax=Bacillus solitudinis TaxID=2014074 RepID=UPI000C230C6C|nr:hypothetical protein [Bacillus solitudinis]
MAIGDRIFVTTKAEHDGLQQEVTAHQAEDAIDAHNATSITVADANSHFTGTNVETVLDELFTFANNGKTDIASVIGSPATVGDTFIQLKTHIQNSKNDLAANLTAKGQSSVGSETLNSLVDKVPLINTGKGFKMGTIPGNYGASWSTTATVSGLPFVPKFIILTYYDNSNPAGTIITHSGKIQNPNNSTYQWSIVKNHTQVGLRVASEPTTTSFTVSFDGTAPTQAHTGLTYIAFEDLYI